MPGVVPATGALLERILDETFPQWGEGLDRTGYARYNAAQLRTPWGASQLHRVALVDGSEWLASAKVYRLRACLDGRETLLIGLGAVFTPRRHRRRGHASELIGRLLSSAAGEGYRLAVLFSEIRPGYYERFGFRPVPLAQVLLGVAPGSFSRPGSRPPGIVMREGEARDLGAVADMNAIQAGGFRFSLIRDPGYIAYAHSKKRLLAACGRPGYRQVQFCVAEEGGRAGAYVVVLETGDHWMVTECGDRDPTGARAGALLQAMLARPGRRPQVRAWLPPGFLPPQLTVLRTELPTVTMMVAPLAGLAFPPLAPHELAWWHGDAF